jgi:hypothetical protein
MTDNTVGLGCNEEGCVCSYCNGDNYDRYMLDSCRQYLDEINAHLPEPIDFHDERIGHSEEQFYKVIKRCVVNIVKQHKDNHETVDE